MFVFAGGKDISSDAPINGLFGPIGSMLSGGVGLGITGYVYLFYKDTIVGDETSKFWLLQRDDRSSFGVFWFMAVAVKYAFEIVDMILGANPLAGSLSHLFSLYMLGGGFPFWLYQCWRIYDFYLDNGAYPAFDGSSTGFETVWAEFALYGTPIVTQILNPINFSSRNTIAVAIGFGYIMFVLFEQGKVIKDNTMLTMWGIAASFYLWALDNAF